MDSNLKTSLAGIAPYLWLFSLGTALTPLSPLSWGLSTWLLFIIPLAITVFAPTRTFSGPLRFAYLEYAQLLTSWLGPLFETFFGTFKTIPTLALPMVFFIPVLPILIFVLLPGLPVAWHYVTYHYRRRLKAVTISVSKTTASLDLAIARVHRAADQASTYEKEALKIVSTTRRTASLQLMLHGVDFFDAAVSSAWAAVGHTAGHTKEVVTAASEVVRLADNVRHTGAASISIYPKPQAEILFEKAKNAETSALHAAGLSQQAQNSVVWSQNGERQATKARQQVQKESEDISSLGTKIAGTVADVEKKVSRVEDEVEKVRAILEQAVAVAVEGEMEEAKTLTTKAENSLQSIIRDVGALCSVADEARRTWVTLSVKT